MEPNITPSLDKTSPKRIAMAVENFFKGYNCSQAICCAWADAYGFTEEQMARMASCFGGGIGRMRLTCGAACGMFLLVGLEEGNTSPGNKDAKAANYSTVQQLAEKFEIANGNLQCSALLKAGGVKPTTHFIPDERTSAYYQKRPCPKIIEETAIIFRNYLLSRQQ